MAADELFGPDGTQAFSLDGPMQPRSAAVRGDMLGDAVRDALGDALGGLVTGPAFEPGDWSGEPPVDEPDSVYSTGNTPFPAAPDQQQLRSAVDKAMMTGPPTNPLRISRPTPLQRVRPAPTVTTASTLNFATTTDLAKTTDFTMTTDFAKTPDFAKQADFAQPPNTAPFPQLTGPLPQLAEPLQFGSRATPAPTPPPTPTQSPVSPPTRSTRMSSGAWPQQTARPVRSSLAGRPTLKSQHPAVSALLKLAALIIFVVVVLLLHGFGGTLSGLFQ